MSRRILVVVGHPDPSPDRLCRGLAQAYAEGAKQAGHVVRQIDLAALDFSMLRTMQEFEHGAIPDSLKDAAGAIVWSEHIVFVFPLWLGTMPALLKAFLEQVMRPGTAFAYPDRGKGFTKALLRGRSARLVVTMGMPSLLFQLWFLGHGILACGEAYSILSASLRCARPCSARSRAPARRRVRNGSDKCASSVGGPDSRLE